MIIVRERFQAKYGQAGQLVQYYKEHRQALEDLFNVPTRVMTDLSGPFDTVILEQEVDSLDHYEQMMQQMFANPNAMTLLGPMTPMIEGGSREFYRVEVEGK